MISANSVGLPELVVVLLIATMVIAVVWPAARICHRLGFPSWLGVLAVIPLANVLLLWFVALARWPSPRSSPRLRAEPCGSCEWTSSDASLWP